MQSAKQVSACGYARLPAELQACLKKLVSRNENELHVTDHVRAKRADYLKFEWSEVGTQARTTEIKYVVGNISDVNCPSPQRFESTGRCVLQ